MKYIRINISTKQGNVVYQYDFDPYQTLQKVAQKFVDTQVLNGTIQRDCSHAGKSGVKLERET